MPLKQVSGGAGLRRLAVSCVVGFGLLPCGSGAAPPRPDTKMLKSLSVEELMDVKVYSATRRLEPTQKVPAAVFVLTAEDIRRSRATTIPEALRLVPGVQVGRVDANKWAVSIRGFNTREANKILVLVDGRTIYDPLFSGVLWEAQDFILEDIDRIEVIRGPGGALWGANAFNGVINIVTRNARDTVGGLASALAGNEETYTAVLRQGWSMGEGNDARVYAKASEHDRGYSEVAPPYDHSKAMRAGFRWDWSLTPRDDFKLSGDVYLSTTGIREEPGLVQDIDHRGRHVLARWNHHFSQGSRLQFKTYFDNVLFESMGFTQKRDTLDVELQHNLPLGARNFLIWGGGHRSLRDSVRSGEGLAGFVDLLPPHRHDEISNVFAQNTFQLLPDRLSLTAGLKYESTDYADPEWLPNVRLAWTPDAKQTWWMAVSEAVRVPSRVEADLTLLGTLRTGDMLGAEQVRAYELGYRHLPASHLSYDVALFYNRYTDLSSTEGLQFGNLMRGSTSGAELGLRWESGDGWQLHLAYTYLYGALRLDPASLENPARPDYLEGLASRHTASLRSLWNLTETVDLDIAVRYVDAVHSLNFPAYVQADLSLGWRPVESLEFALVGRNLLRAHQPEHDFALSGSGMPTENQRDFFGRVTWRF